MTEIISKKRKRDNKVIELIENIKLIQTKWEFSITEIAWLFWEHYQNISRLLNKWTQFKISFKKADQLNLKALEIINKIK